METKSDLRQKILILSFSDLSRDPRVYRQVMFINERYDIVTSGYGKLNEMNVFNINIEKPSNRLLRDKVPIALLMFLKLFEACYWNFPVIKNGIKALSQLDYQSFDLIIANDLISLPIALKKAEQWKSKVLLDAHEYTPRQYGEQWINKFVFPKFWDYICKKYLRKIDGMITVCQGIADEYKKNYGVNCEVITNAPFYSKLAPSSSDKKRIRIIYHGLVHKSRMSENMINLMDHLDDRFELDLMIIRDNSRYNKRIYDLAVNHPRIFLKDTVPMPQISHTLNEYDIGLFLLPQESFSYRMALPNKLFEFIQGRLAIAIWPSPEMARILTEYNCGIVSKDYTIESMAKGLNSLTTQDIMKFKQNSHRAADFLCAEKNREKFLSIVKKVIYS
jgi:hypothetical protein